MVLLNNVGILWHFDKIDNLEQNIKAALSSWNKHKDTRDIVPDRIRFNNNQIIPDNIKQLITDLNLDIDYIQTVQLNHFQIEGKLY